MEEIILKIIGENCGITSIILRKVAAKELTELFAGFFNWFCWKDHQFAVEGDFDGNMIIIEHDKYFNRVRVLELEELFNYWYSQIREK